MENASRSPLRKFIVAGKVILAAALLAYLLFKAQQHERFRELVEQPKNWWLLAAGFGCTFLSILLSFLRWRKLVLAQGIEFPTAEALRLGALGHVLNFVSLGSLGGDFFKAVFLAHKKPGKRTEAIATVIVDRVLGLTMMLLLASIGILATGLLKSDDVALRSLCQLILLSTTGGLCGAVLLLYVPALTGDRVIEWVEKLPLVGSTAGRLLGAARAYRHQKNMLFQAAAISLVVDVLFILSFFLVAKGLPVQSPYFVEHLVIVPVANLAGAIPITPAGLGTLELATDKLYEAMPGIDAGVGTIVTLAHRLTMAAVAMVGLIYYFAYRTEVREVMAEAEALAQS